MSHGNTERKYRTVLRQTSQRTLIDYDADDVNIRGFVLAKSRSRRNCCLSIMDRSAGGGSTHRQRSTAVGHDGRMLPTRQQQLHTRTRGRPASDARSKTQWPPASDNVRPIDGRD